MLCEHARRLAGSNGSADHALYTYFTLGMNRAAAARRLEIHPNTLDYRLRQARASYGADLTSTKFAFRLQLAVRLLPLCRSVTRSQPGGRSPDMSPKTQAPPPDTLEA